MGLFDRVFPSIARRKRERRLIEARERAYQANRTPEAIEAAKQRWGRQAKACPSCGTPAMNLIWSYYESSVAAWEHGAGCFGWRTACPSCPGHVEEFVEGIG